MPRQSLLHDAVLRGHIQSALASLFARFFLPFAMTVGLSVSIAGGAVVEVSGAISNQTTWVSSNTYHAVSNVIVASGASLTVAPGTVVKFAPAVSLTIEGEHLSVGEPGHRPSGVLSCIGTASNSIVFTSLKDDSFEGDTNEDGPTSPQPGDWRGIIVESPDVDLRHCTVAYAGDGDNQHASLDIRDVVGESVIIDHCRFILPDAVAIRAAGADILLEYCHFRSSVSNMWSTPVIQVTGTVGRMYGNIVTNCQMGIGANGCVDLLIASNTVYASSEGIRVENSEILVSGNRVVGTPVNSWEPSCGIIAYGCGSNTVVSGNHVTGWVSDSGPVDGARGIRLGDASCIVISNRIESCESGVSVVQGFDGTVSHNVISNAAYGVYVSDSTNAVIASNAVYASSEGITVLNSATLVCDNTVQSTQPNSWEFARGIMISGSDSNTVVAGNTVVGWVNDSSWDGNSGITLGDTSCMVVSNTIVSCLPGVGVIQGFSGVLAHNLITNVQPNSVGVYVNNSTNGVVASNTVYASGAGIEVHNSEIVVDGNTVVGTADNSIEPRRGIIAYFCGSNMVVSRNTVIGWTHDGWDGYGGISLGDTSCMVASNTIVSCSPGVGVIQGFSGTIRDNCITNVQPDSVGVYVNYSTNGVVASNTVYASGAGIEVHNSEIVVDGNTVVGTANNSMGPRRGIVAYFCGSNMVVSCNTVSGWDYSGWDGYGGISLGDTSCMVVSNTIVSCSPGIGVIQGFSGTICENLITNAQSDTVGIHVTLSTNAVIVSNSVFNGGIHVNEGVYCVAGNSLRGEGIQSHFCEANTRIVGNSIEVDGDSASCVYLGAAACTVASNRLAGGQSAFSFYGDVSAVRIIANVIEGSSTTHAMKFEGSSIPQEISGNDFAAASEHYFPFYGHPDHGAEFIRTPPQNWPYVIDSDDAVGGDLTVHDGVRVDVSPGSSIGFSDSALIVHGELNSLGTEASPIAFTSSRSPKAPGDWHGIRSVGGVLELVNTTVEYAGGDSSHGANVYLSGGSAELSGCAISDGLRSGVALNSAVATISDCQILDNGEGVTVQGNCSGTTISGNDIVGNGLGVRNASSVRIDCRNNWWGNISGPQTGDGVEGVVSYSPWLQSSIESLGILTSVQARQASDGSGDVIVDYTLDLPASGSADVSVAFSANGGVSWDIIPAAGLLEGDFGSGISSGTRQLKWKAGSQLPSSTFNANFHARLQVAYGGESFVGSSEEPFSLDLTGGVVGVSVMGIITDAKTHEALAGVQVSVGSSEVLTDETGRYSLSGVKLSSTNVIEFSLQEYLSVTRPLLARAGEKTIVYDRALVPTDGLERPMVTALTCRYRNAFFLEGLPLNNNYIASVHWGDGHQPGSVVFSIDGQEFRTVAGGSPPYTCAVQPGLDVTPSLRSGERKIRVVAKSLNGVESEPLEADINVFPLFWPLADVLVFPGSLLGLAPGLEDLKLKASLNLPLPGTGRVIDIPFLGRFGAQLGVVGGAEYSFASGDFTLYAGGGAGDQGWGLSSYDNGQCYFAFGQDRVDIEVLGEVSGNLSHEVYGTLHAGLTFKRPIKRFSPLDAIPLATDLAASLGLEAALKPVMITLYGVLNLEGGITFTIHPEFAPKSVQAYAGVGIEAAYEPKLSDIVQGRIYCGGEGGLLLQYPGDFIGQLRFRGYYGLEFTAWVFQHSVEGVLFDIRIPEDATLDSLSFSPKMASSRDGSSFGFTLAPRAHLASGKEGCTLPPSGDGSPRVQNYDGAPSHALQVFCSMKREIMDEDIALMSLSSGPHSPGIMQVELPVITNAFPYSEPCLSGYGQELMLVWVADNAHSNDLQYADIHWLYFDGSDWSVPGAMAEDTRAEFSPQVAFDGDGDAIAVWQRVNDSNFTNVNISAMAEEMEIVWSRWERTTGLWRAPAALTTNGFYDGAPMLAGPMDNGDLLLAWVENRENLLMGTGNPGDSENDVINWSRWSSSGDSWEAPSILVSNMAYRTSHSFAGASNRAVYAWSQDMDGVMTNDVDQELFYRELAGGTWEDIVQLTSDVTVDKNVRVAVSSGSQSGSVHMVWQRGNDLVSDSDFSGLPVRVRSESAGMGFSDYAMTCGPDGNLVLLWQEMTEYGSDAHYSVYDPVSDSWSLDATFFNDASLERSFSPVWDSAGQLNFAYNKVDIVITNEIVELEGGGSVTVSNVPQQGRVDIAVAVRRLITDVGLPDGSFTVDGENYLPGDAVTLSASLHNSGDVAVSNAAVAFYDGDPDLNGSLITNLVWSGWLEGAATNAILATTWVVPEPATNHTLYAVANPNRSFSEFSYNNNTQIVVIGGSDVSASLVSALAATNGSVRVIAEIRSLGAPGVTNTTVAVRRKGESGSYLASADVPSLEPGRLAQVALDLPAGTQPEGTALYTLYADADGIVSDVDTNNNTASFSVNLWLDTDDDGIPDGWESSFFGGTTNAQPEVDQDHDGMNNYAEWRAGTDPNDPESFLNVSSIVPMGGNTTSGVQLSWGSASNRLYSVSRAFGLVDGVGFVPIAEQIAATPPINTFVDDSLPGGNTLPVFYRIEVE